MTRAARVPLGAVPARRSQRGIAALEFSLVLFFVLLPLFYGMATFGAVLYAQQAVTRAAEDGARAANVLHTPVGQSPEGTIRNVVHESLSRSLVVPVEHNASEAARLAWIVQNTSVGVAFPVAGGPAAGAVVSVSYPYSANRLLPSLPLLDSSRWMPDDLRSRATVALRH